MSRNERTPADGEISPYYYDGVVESVINSYKRKGVETDRSNLTVRAQSAILQKAEKGETQFEKGLDEKGREQFDEYGRLVIRVRQRRK